MNAYLRCVVLRGPGSFNPTLYEEKDPVRYEKDRRRFVVSSVPPARQVVVCGYLGGSRVYCDAHFGAVVAPALTRHPLVLEAGGGVRQSVFRVGVHSLPVHQ